jgi:uroporphyrinogen decarboxylase
MGNPDPETWPIYYAYFGTESQEEIRCGLDDDFRWICTQHTDTVYQHPEGKPFFDLGERKSLDAGGPLADAQTLDDLKNFEWPNVDYLNFDECLKKLDAAGDVYRASGFWCCFFHDMADLFGMENYLMNMYLKPDLMHAATDRICEFYYEANERFFKQAGDKVDAFFFGNDFGTQNGLICGLKQFEEFILPWTKRLVELAKKYGYQVILHSCGSIYEVIDIFIDLGIDCLHPIQAKALNMDAQTLADNFKGKISFMGGIDTQDLLVNAGADEIKAETQRVKALLEPYVIISPSHEALLPNVPAENVVAMAEAAKAKSLPVRKVSS